MANDTSGSTMTLCVGGVSPNLLEIIRAIESVKAATYDAIAIPAEVLRALDDARPTSTHEIAARMREALPTLFGMQVLVNNTLQDMPVRVHKKRRWMRESYHRRIQKKWNKRFGVGPMAVLMNTEMLRATSTGSNSK